MIVFFKLEIDCTVLRFLIQDLVEEDLRFNNRKLLQRFLQDLKQWLDEDQFTQLLVHICHIPLLTPRIVMAEEGII